MAIIIAQLDLVGVCRLSITDLVIILWIRGIGNFLGTIMSGWVFKTCEKIFTFGTLIIILGIAQAYIAKVATFDSLKICLLVAGLCCGIMEPEKYVFLSKIWKEKNNSLIKAMPICQYLASAVTALAFIPFLSNTEIEDQFSVSKNASSCFDYTSESKIEIPFLVQGGIAIWVGILSILFQTWLKLKERRKMSRKTNAKVKQVKSEEESALHEVKDEDEDNFNRDSGDQVDEDTLKLFGVPRFVAIAAFY
ncbi:hypothetical protein B4U79_18303 [Dinothrombium tinctorium]|uniref:Sodium-dependent glucose transporter 1-like protein n=1 Tax=Dinothrombium tinctorium TaxID=1965070 RepID=A0A3S3NML4_9ACAR|nr:hypothetical protein B4U79_18303 [Dinothrombium tinctorium]